MATNIKTRQAWNAPHAPKQVLAYHGCRADIAERILNGEDFLQSTNEYDWLGSGVYFWEHAPNRALDWAQQRFEDAATVIEATVTLSKCLNLLDSVHFTNLQLAYTKVVQTLKTEGLQLPVSKNGRHTLDRLVVDTYCKEYNEETDTPFVAVKGCFPEGKPVYDGSQILQYTHVQIAVRELSCISELKLVQFY